MNYVHVYRALESSMAEGRRRSRGVLGFGLSVASRLTGGLATPLLGHGVACVRRMSN